jgi:hypothetical protein
MMARPWMCPDAPKTISAWIPLTQRGNQRTCSN